MVVRHDVDVESIGIMAALPEDMSPLQIGTGGFYHTMRFTIIGRMKMSWENGLWNEWFLYMDNGRKGWLAEAQGSYAISLEWDALYAPEQEALNKTITLIQDAIAKRSIIKNSINTVLGSYVTLGNHSFKIVDIKYATCIGSEGELPFSAPKGRNTLSLDLLAGGDEFACIEICEGKQRIYIGHYVQWDEMRCDNVRLLEGW
jgi:hypothetical protein